MLPLHSTIQGFAELFSVKTQINIYPFHMRDSEIKNPKYNPQKSSLGNFIGLSYRALMSGHIKE